MMPPRRFREVDGLSFHRRDLLEADSRRHLPSPDMITPACAFRESYISGHGHFTTPPSSPEGHGRRAAGRQAMSSRCSRERYDERSHDD